jgi:K+-sensing histidine kinase KdpD
MSFWALSGLINGVTSSLLGVAVYTRKRRSKLNITFGLFCLSISVWSYSYFLWLISKDAVSALFWSRALMAGAIFIPVCYMHHIFSLLRIYRQKKKIVRYGYIFGFISLLLNFTPLFVKSVSPKMWFQYWPNAGLLFYPFLSIWLGFVFYGTYIIIESLLRAKGNIRNQRRYILIATIIGWCGGAMNFPLWFDIPVPPVGNILVSVYVIIVAYAIIKYHLMDTRVAVTRAGLFLIVYPFVFGLPFWFGFKTGNWILSVILMAALATLGPLIYNRLSKKAEGIIFKSQKRYQKALKKFASTLISIKDVKQLSQTVILEIMNAVDLDFCGIYLKKDKNFYLTASKSRKIVLPEKVASNSKFLRKLRDSKTTVLGAHFSKLENIYVGLVSPLYLNRSLYGFIVLSHRKNDIFTKSDLEVFSVLSAQISLALSEIHYFQEYKKATEEKYKIKIEKERLESAFQISEAYRHELGNIINIITLASGSLQGGGYYQPSEEDIKEAAAAIYKNTQRASNIFNAVKHYNDKAQSDFKKISLGEVLKSKIEECKEKIEQSNINIKMNIKDNLIVKGNEALEHALKYVIEGAVTAINYYKPKDRLISIKLENNEERAVLRISDTGKDVTVNNIYNGVGIERGKEGGILYFIARRIVFEHRGSFEIESYRGGKGSSFIINLPLSN